MAATKTTVTCIYLILLFSTCVPISSIGDVPSIEKDGETVVASWDLSTADNLTTENMTISGGNATLAKSSGRFDLGIADLLVGTSTDLVSSGGALELMRTENWWDVNYTFRLPVHIFNKDGTDLPQNFTYNMTLDTASLVIGAKMRGDLHDLRVVKQSGGTFTELDRAVLYPNNISSTVLFKGDASLASGSWSNSTYYIYYGNPTANAPPENRSRVYLYYDDFSADTRSSYLVQNCLLDQNGGTAVLSHDAINGRLDVTASAANAGTTLIAPVQAHNARIEANMQVNTYYRIGQRDSNLELVARYIDLQNYYIESFSTAWNDPSIQKWVAGVRTGPLDTAPGVHPGQNIEHLVWMSVVNGTIKGGFDNTEHLSATDASLGGNGSLGFGISSADGYIDNLTVRLDIEKWPSVKKGVEEGMFRSPGTLVSKPVAATTAVIWNVINWSLVKPAGTDVTINTRTSPDGMNWTPWSLDLTNSSGSSVQSIPDRYLQFKAVLRSTGTNRTPSISGVGVNYTKFEVNGIIETEDISFSQVIGWTELNVTDDHSSAPGSSIIWEASINSGISWVAVPNDGNLSSLGQSGQLRLKATIKTDNTTRTPSLDKFTVQLLVNRGPALKAPVSPLSFPEDTRLLDAVNLTTIFQDDGGLTFEGASNDSNLSVTVHINGSVDLSTTVMNWTGKANVTFKATDDFGMWVEARTEVTVTPVNDAPTILSIPSTVTLALKNYTYAVHATDIDGDILTYSLQKAPSGMTVGADGLVQWVPNLTQLGPNSVNLSVSDQVVKVYQDFTIIVEREGGNHPPVIQSSPQLIAMPGSEYKYQVEATDADNDSLTYALDQTPAGMTIDPKTGIINWIPGQGQIGNASVVVNVSDIFLFATQSFTIRVIPDDFSPPIIKTLPTQLLKGKEIKIDLSKYVTYPNNDMANWTWNIGNYSSELFTVYIEGSILTLTPLKDATGTGNLTLVLKDARGHNVPATIDVEVKKQTKAQFVLTLGMFLLIVVLLVVACIFIIGLAASRKRPATQTGRKEFTPKAGPASTPAVVVPVKHAEEKPAPIQKIFDGGADIAKATEFMTKILNAHIAEGLTKEEQDSLAGVLGTLDKDPVIRSIKVDDKGQIALEADVKATLDSVAVAYSAMFDSLTIACYINENSKWDRKARLAATSVVQKVLGEEKGPAATALRTRLIQGALSERLTSGIPGLDEFLGGGIPKGEAVLFQVPAGSVKDMLMDQVLKETIRSNQGVIVTLSNMSPARFLADADKKKIKVKSWADLGELRIVDWHSYKTMRVKEVEENGFVHKSTVSLTNLAIAITDASKKLKDDLVKRGLFEIITPAITIFGIDPVFKLVQSLVARLKEGGFTSIFLIESDMHEEEDIATLSQNFDTIIEIVRKKDDRAVTMEVCVLSMSVPGYSSEVRKIEVTENGLVVKVGR